MFSFTTLSTKWTEEIMVLNPVDLARDFSKGNSVNDLIGKVLCSHEDRFGECAWIIWSHINNWDAYDVQTLHFDYGSSKMVLFKFYEKER